MKTIVVIGATGHFGGRICRRIAGENDVALVVTSRSLERAQDLATELLSSHHDATIIAAKLDQQSPNLGDELRTLNPDIVIHTVGPYQGQDYRVAEACIACGSHYIDLADGRDFVQGISALDKAARERDVLVVSGASTLPGLSSVVIDSLRSDFRQIDRIEISIAPAHQTPRGASTVAAVLSYCGMPFEVLENGVFVTRYGWQDMKTQRYPDLGSRLSGACDVPDLALLPTYVEGVSTVTFHAALEATWEQVSLWLMAWITRSGLVRKWARCIPMFQRMSNLLIRLGSDVGGMHIRLTGSADDMSSKSVVWYLTARQNHGPEIPCSPALLLARKLVAGELAQRGALPCLGMFNLTDFEREVEDLNIRWEVCEGD